MTHTQKETEAELSRLHKTATWPTRNLLAPLDELDHLFNQLKSFDWTQQFHWLDTLQPHIPLFTDAKIPKVDILDRDKELLIRAELPGVEKKGLDISMTSNAITIKATTRYKDKDIKSDYYRAEITHGQYARTIGLPANVDIDQIKTSFKNGILEITAPKLEHAQRRSIKVE